MYYGWYEDPSFSQTVGLFLGSILVSLLMLLPVAVVYLAARRNYWWATNDFTELGAMLFMCIAFCIVASTFILMLVVGASDLGTLVGF